jgi:hypothetical protein
MIIFIIDSLHISCSCSCSCADSLDLQQEVWSCLLNATEGAPKPETCFWYRLDYTWLDSKWTYAEMVH